MTPPARTVRHRAGSLTMHAARVTTAVIILTGCHAPPDEPASAPNLSTVAVAVQTVNAVTRPATEATVGTVTARQRPVVAAKVGGTVAALHADVGDPVTTGMILAELSAPEITARLNQALPEMTRAAQDLERISSLLRQSAVSQGDFDSATARFNAASAAVDEAETLRGYTTVTAPIAGVVRSRPVEVGDLATPGRPLFNLETIDAPRFEASIPEQLTGRLTRGDQVAILIDARDTPVTGTLAEVAPSADPMSRTFLTRFDLATTSGLVAGQFGRALIPVGTVTEIRIPATAIVRRGQLETVFVVDGNVAALRIIKTAPAPAGQALVLSGLDPGETIVINGAARLTDGQPVEVTR